MKKIVGLVWLVIAVGTVSYAGKNVAPATSPVVVADEISPWYIGGGFVWAKYAIDGVNDNDVACHYEDVTYGAMLRGGYDFNQYFGIEARVLRTFWDKGPFGGVTLQHIGLYAKPQIPLSDRLNLYGLLGYGYTESLGTGARLKKFDHDSGFSAGIGLEYDLSDAEDEYEAGAGYDRAFDGHADQGKGWSLFVDYQRLLVKSGAPDMDVISFGLRRDF